ncbi:hypothetical protein TNCT_398091 [Trichonephila clavata]|uniref:Transposase n=1 Tax=Trichonephila clavata TaxID=2740835 RepID=A0A8X6HWU4_TRICU|nr:hypothetical protein TNCT_398091 [Trichonephila clavata]
MGMLLAAVREIHCRKNLLHGSMSAKGIRGMIKRFKETGKFVQPGRGRKRVTPVLFDGIKIAVDSRSQALEFGGSSACAVSRETSYSYNSVQKVLRKHNALLPIHDPPNPGAA